MKWNLPCVANLVGVLLVGIVLPAFFSCTRERLPVDAPLTPSPPQAASFWMPSTGPGLSSVLAVAADASGNIFAGTQGAGIFKSADRGQSWSRFNSGLFDLTVRSLLVDSANRLFAGTAVGGVWSSSPASANWQSTNLSTLVWTIFQHPNGQLFAGTIDGMFRSNDGGEQWTEFSTGLGSTSVLSISANSRGQIFAGTSQNGVFISTNNGATWSPLGLAGATVSTLYVDSNDRIYAGTQGIGLFRTVGTTNTWAQVTSFSPTIVYVLVANSLGHIFAGVNEAGVLRSTDGGETWQNLSSELDSKTVFALALDDRENLIAGTVAGLVYRTVNSTLPPDDPGGN